MSNKKKKAIVAENTTPFAIDNGVPIPPYALGAGRPSKYPFASLTAGQSFFVSAEQTRPESVRSAAARFNKRNAGGGKLVTRLEAGGVRIWKAE